MALQGRATVRSTKVSTTLTTAARREKEVEMSEGGQVERQGSTQVIQIMNNFAPTLN